MEILRMLRPQLRGKELRCVQPVSIQTLVHTVNVAYIQQKLHVCKQLLLAERNDGKRESDLNAGERLT